MAGIHYHAGVDDHWINGRHSHHARVDDEWIDSRTDYDAALSYCLLL
jgi:hypothetical protein